MPKLIVHINHDQFRDMEDHFAFFVEATNTWDIPDWLKNIGIAIGSVCR